MRVLLFQDRFAESVRAGEKRQTIRQTARCKPGDTLSLRRWTGKPRRSKQEILALATCLSVSRITLGHGIYHDGVAINDVDCMLLERIAVAEADGFPCSRDMLNWFRQVHGLPFDGVLIRWTIP